MENHKAWLRVAGNATKIKSGHSHGWRCRVEGNPNEFALVDWSVSGVASQVNFIPGINAKSDKNGYVAWIDCFGFYTIENEVLHIILLKPSSPPPTYNA